MVDTKKVFLFPVWTLSFFVCDGKQLLDLFGVSKFRTESNDAEKPNEIMSPA